MRKSRHLLLIAFFLLVSFGLWKHFSYSSKEVISNILKTDAYSYLSSEAKNYIEDVYVKTGNIVLTEKNQEANKPFLNPKYVLHELLLLIFLL